MLGTPPDVVPLALSYLRAVFLAMPAMLMFTLFTMALRGIADSTAPLLFIGASVVVDSGSNPLLILGLRPLPELGIGGRGSPPQAPSTWRRLCSWAMQVRPFR